MQVNFITDLDAAGRYQVVDLDSGEEIENVAWADEDAGVYHVFCMRGRVLADASDADLRLRDKDGDFRVKAYDGDIQIVDLAENPIKGPLLALLDDPEVVAKLRSVLKPKSIQELTGGGMP